MVVVGGGAPRGVGALVVDWSSVRLCKCGDGLNFKLKGMQHTCGNPRELTKALVATSPLTSSSNAASCMHALIEYVYIVDI